VAKDGRALFQVRPRSSELNIRERDLKGDELLLSAEGDKVPVRVIQVLPDHIESCSIITELPVLQGRVRADPRQDVLLLVLANRYLDERPVLGFVKGFGLGRGALATSVAHDSHHLLAVGVDPEDMARAINAVSRRGGFAVSDGERLEQLELNVAGLMSTSPLEEVASKEVSLLGMLRGMGCTLPAPFMTLSFQSLLVVPELKIGDRGLFDTQRMEFVSPLL
jgi:adenine deaminase